MSIEVRDLHFDYLPGTKMATSALRGVTMRAERGEWLSIVGHTGCGKSTLAQHLNGLYFAQRGSVTVDGAEITQKSKDIALIRRKVGLVFQYPEVQFFAETVREEIAYAPMNAGATGEDLSRATAEAAECCGLGQEMMERSPFALSGGQMRRVALASVLSMKPEYLVLDEPFAGLDENGIRDLSALLSRLRDEGIGVIQITHDIERAVALSDKMLVMEMGRDVYYGDPEGAVEHLAEHPAKGLQLPDLVRFCAGLRSRGVEIRLTAGIDEIVRAVKKRKEAK